jgi:hypothetical protein
MKDLHTRRAKIELSLIPANFFPNSFWVTGFCAVCQRKLIDI